MSVQIGLPNTLQDIITKVRRVTARPSQSQISDQEIVRYINTFYIYDMPEHLRLESLRVNYQFLTNANTPAYDLPTSIFLDIMPPVFIAGYQSYMTQSRENFFRINPELNFLQQQAAVSGTFPITIQCTETPLLKGFKQNPPGAYSATAVKTSTLNWNVLVTALDAAGNSQSVVDDGQGNLVSPTDPAIPPASPVIYGSVNYATGVVKLLSFPGSIPTGNYFSIQYIPYVASRPQSCVFFQDQILLYPIPDQAYTVSFEAYQYPVSFSVLQNPDGSISITYTTIPQVAEWWQLLAYGAADKIFADSGDFEMMAKFRPLMQEQMQLVLRRTIVQQTSERVSTIYTEQTAFPSYPFGNLFTGF